jgi:Fe2+ transport system protein FeoA
MTNDEKKQVKKLKLKKEISKKVKRLGILENVKFDVNQKIIKFENKFITIDENILKK